VHHEYGRLTLATAGLVLFIFIKNVLKTRLQKFFFLIFSLTFVTTMGGTEHVVHVVCLYMCTC